MSAPATTHDYRAILEWSGAASGPTRDYASFSRAFTARIEGKPRIDGSSDPAFKGDPAALNPEDLLLISLSSCHMLSYLALCSNSGIQVAAYRDEAVATLAQQPDRNWQMASAVLRPRVRLASGDAAKALKLHERAHAICFIARSVNFPVTNEPQLDPG
jgi:organic hydroperoxide reductase OsmC/OhrA